MHYHNHFPLPSDKLFILIIGALVSLSGRGVSADTPYVSLRPANETARPIRDSWFAGNRSASPPTRVFLDCVPGRPAWWEDWVDQNPERVPVAARLKTDGSPLHPFRTRERRSPHSTRKDTRRHSLGRLVW